MTGEAIRYWAVIPAAGSGQRMGADIPKQYLLLNDKPIIEKTVSVFTRHSSIEKVVVVLSKDDDRWTPVNIPKSKKIIEAVGGKTRADSVFQGLERLVTLASPHDWVLVHDAVRPFLTHALIDRLIQALDDHPVGGILAVPVADTLKKIGLDQSIEATVSREHLWAAQTPQMFRFHLLHAALQDALTAKANITDEANAIERMGQHPIVVPGDPRNIKITCPEDL